MRDLFIYLFIYLKELAHVNVGPDRSKIFWKGQLAGDSGES